uniref:Retrovirus-related Pol polyprotein from transposon TNT 1-94-like beta-barrel domain-containing protein n=2 Tax=Oryza TaxID=4527 RepID=A0A0E0F8J4_9ORYZ
MASSASWPAFGVSPEEAGKGKWYIATAATNHMTNDKSLISDLKPVADGRNIIADGNGAGLKVQGRGAVNTETVVLPAEVWYVPEIDENLVSVDQLNELGLSISIGRGVCTVTRVSDGSVVGKARRSGGVYEVEFLKFLSSSPRALAASPPSASPPPADSSEMASYPVFQVSPEEAAKGKWYMATAATNHMTRDQSLISDLKPVTGHVVSRGNGAGLKVHGSGAVNTETVAIPDVWHVPGINANLVSVPQLSLLGLNISFDRGGCTFLSSSPGAHTLASSASPPPLCKMLCKISPDEAAKGKWYIATAATNHMTRDQSVISDLKPMTGRVVGGGNGAGLQVHGSGAVNTETVVIPDVWYVPGINCNLVSVGQLCQLGLEVSIFRGVCTVTRASDGSVVGKAHRSGAVYEVEFLKLFSRAYRVRLKKPEERANANVSSLSNIFISAEPGATMPRWFITEAATNHMTSDKSIFSDLKPMAGLVIDGRAGAGAGLPMHGIGAVYSWEVVLQDVWYVPGMSTYIGLVSAGQLTAIGLKTEIAGDVCTITSADGSEVGKGRMVSDGIFQVDFLRVSV